MGCMYVCPACLCVRGWVCVFVRAHVCVCVCKCLCLGRWVCVCAGVCGGYRVQVGRWWEGLKTYCPQITFYQHLLNFPCLLCSSSLHVHYASMFQPVVRMSMVYASPKGQSPYEKFAGTTVIIK